MSKQGNNSVKDLVGVAVAALEEAILEMEEAIGDFDADPTEENYEAAQEALEAAQEAQSEAYIVAKGTIAGLETALEGAENELGNPSGTDVMTDDEVAATGAYAAMETAIGERDAAQAAMEEAREARDAQLSVVNDRYAVNEARTALTNANTVANDAVDAANTAISAHDTAVRAFNDLQRAVNSAIYDINNFDGNGNLDELRAAHTAAQTALNDFVNNNNLDQLENTRDDLTQIADDLLYDINRVGGLQEAYDSAAALLNSAINTLNTLETAYHNAQITHRDAVEAVNNAKTALYEAREAVHEASENLREAEELVAHLQEVAGILEANATSISDFWQEHEDFVNTEEFQLYLTVREAWEKGLDGDAYADAVNTYNAAKDQYNADREAWDAWQAKRPADGSGIDVDIYSFKGTDISGQRPGHDGIEIAPGVRAYGGQGNDPVILKITEEAGQGTIVLGVRHGNDSEIHTINIFGAGEFTLKMHPNENMAQFQRISVDLRNEPVFDLSIPVYRGPEPTPPEGAPQLEIDPIPENEFIRGEFTDVPVPDQVPVVGSPPIPHDTYVKYDGVPRDLEYLETPSVEQPDELYEPGDDPTPPGNPPPGDPEPEPEPIPGPAPEEPELIPGLGPVPAPVIPAVFLADVEDAVFEIDDEIVPLAPPVETEPEEYDTIITIEAAAVPLAPAELSEFAGFMTTGLILAALTVAVMGNAIRKMRTEEIAEEQE